MLGAIQGVAADPQQKEALATWEAAALQSLSPCLRQPKVAAPAGRHLTQASGNSVDSAGNMISALKAAAASEDVTASAGPGDVGTGSSASRVATGGTRNLGGRHLAES